MLKIFFHIFYDSVSIILRNQVKLQGKSICHITENIFGDAPLKIAFLLIPQILHNCRLQLSAIAEKRFAASMSSIYRARYSPARKAITIIKLL